MCICCIICNSSERFPFIMCSVRDEMYTRPTSDLKVHPVSGTTCCLDESLPEDKRGTWLAINHKLGTFSLLTNSSQQGRPEPPKAVVPSRGLLVLSAAETKNGRLSEPTLAVPVSWTNSSGLNPVEQKLAIERFESIIKAEQEKEKIKILTPPDVSKQSSPVIRTSDTPMLSNDEVVRDKSFPLRENIFASKEAIKPLSGFNLLSGSLLPGKLDVRFSSNLYDEEFDKCLHCDDENEDEQEKTSSSTATSTSPKGWSMSNTFLDNPWEPRLKYLKDHVKETLKNYFNKGEEHTEQQQQQSKRKEVESLANVLGDCMIAQPNFSDEALPVEHLNLSEKDKKNPLEVELERACQRNISSYCEWLDDGPSPVTATENNNKNGGKEKEKETSSSSSSMSSRHASADHQQQQEEQHQKVMFETYQPAHGGKVIESPNEETEGDTDMMKERHNSRKIKSIGMVTPHCTFQTPKHHCRFDWGTRTHIIVITEKIFDEEKDERLKDIVSQLKETETKSKTIDCLIHFFIRPIHARVDENGPRHGPAHQPNFELVPGDWKHLTLPHYVYNSE